MISLFVRSHIDTKNLTKSLSFHSEVESKYFDYNYRINYHEVSNLYGKCFTTQLVPTCTFSYYKSKRNGSRQGWRCLGWHWFTQFIELFTRKWVKNKNKNYINKVDKTLWCVVFMLFFQCNPINILQTHSTNLKFVLNLHQLMLAIQVPKYKFGIR